jgi:hypothetical protein
MPDPQSIELPIYAESAHFTVDLALGKTRFACDLDVCHGACCTMPADAGAPILESEIAELERVFPIVKKYLSEESLATIAKEGLWKREADGTLTIPAIRGRDCVFVTYDEPNSSSSDKRKGQASPTMRGGGVALCAIEKAHRAGETQGFPKPISCHLFPIRIYPNGENKYDIIYEEIPECKGGRARGKREKVPLLEFLDSPLVRALGEERIARLKAAILDL